MEPHLQLDHLRTLDETLPPHRNDLTVSKPRKIELNTRIPMTRFLQDVVHQMECEMHRQEKGKNL